MTEHVDPSDVVDESMIEEGPEPAAEQAQQAASGPPGSGPMQMLFRTEAPPDVNPSSIEMDYGLSKGKSLVIFGLMKAAGSGGMPAIGDITLGGFLEFQDMQSSSSDNEGTEIETVEEQPVDGVPEE